jgi:hypothetical protein
MRGESNVINRNVKKVGGARYGLKNTGISNRIPWKVHNEKSTGRIMEII